MNRFTFNPNSKPPQGELDLQYPLLDKIYFKCKQTLYMHLYCFDNVFFFGRYRTQSVDLIDNSVFPGLGGKWVYAVPGFNISFTPDLSLRGSIDLPVYRNLYGSQLTTTYRYTMALFYNLNPRKNKISNTIKFGEL